MGRERRQGDNEHGGVWVMGRERFGGRCRSHGFGVTGRMGRGAEVERFVTGFIAVRCRCLGNAQAVSDSNSSDLEFLGLGI